MFNFFFHFYIFIWKNTLIIFLNFYNQNLKKFKNIFSISLIKSKNKISRNIFEFYFLKLNFVFYTFGIFK